MPAAAAARMARQRRGLPSLERPRRAHGCVPRESEPAPVDRQPPVIVWDDAIGWAVADRGSAGWRSSVSRFCGKLVP